MPGEINTKLAVMLHSFLYTAPRGSGSYTYNATFNGDGTYLSTSTVTAVTLNKRPVNLVTNTVVSYTLDVFTTTATLKDGLNNSNIQSKPVIFYFNGSSNTVTTNSQGIAASTFTAPTSSGTYTYDVTFNTDSTYLSTSTFNTAVTVNPRPVNLITVPVVVYANNVFTATATLKDVLSGGNVQNKPVIFFFNGSSNTVTMDTTDLSTGRLGASQRRQLQTYPQGYPQTYPQGWLFIGINVSRETNVPIKTEIRKIKDDIAEM